MSICVLTLISRRNIPNILSVYIHKNAILLTHICFNFEWGGSSPISLLSEIRPTTVSLIHEWNYIY